MRFRYSLLFVGVGGVGFSGVRGTDLDFGVPGDFNGGSVGKDSGALCVGNLDCDFDLGANISPFA